MTDTPSPEALQAARDACLPLLQQRPCTGDDIEDPGLVLKRRDFDCLIARNALAIDRAVTAERERFAAEIRVMHDAWQKYHAYNQGMSGGYGNPLLAEALMRRIEKMARGEQP